MSVKQKKLFTVLCAFCFSTAVMPAVQAMHIMEGYLPVTFCVAWGVVCVPFLVLGFFGIKKKISELRQTLMLIALCGAFVFVISSLKIPSVTGSCSHMTGTGLSAVLFGPCITSVLGIIVLLFQAILLAHGGLTTLGANCFSMAIAGPILSWFIYKVLSKAGVNRRATIFLAAALGDVCTYCVTAFQLAIAYPADKGGFFVSFLKFLGVFAPTQLPLAVVEGILTVVIFIGLENYAGKELKSLGFSIGGKKK